MANPFNEHIPTEKERLLVKTSAGLGLPQEQIASLIGVTAKTLAKHYRDELVIGKAEACSKVAESLFNKAVNGDTTAMIWWTKAQMRWSETVKQELAGADGGPLTISLLPQDEKA